MSVGQRFAGVGGYFEFASNAVLSASPLVPGVQVTFPVQMDYAYAFAFTSATDLNGYTLPTSSGVIPPLWISGTRSDFNDHLLFPNMKRVTHAASVVPLGVVILDGPLYVSQVRGTAVITLKYTYTPSSEPPIDPGVPEPASALLLMAGASVVTARHGWRRRRRP